MRAARRSACCCYWSPSSNAPWLDARRPQVGLLLLLGGLLYAAELDHRVAYLAVDAPSVP